MAMNIRKIEIDGKKNWYSISDFENTLKIYEDANGRLVYNLNTTTNFFADASDLEKYTCDHDMFWPLISYKIYGTPRLWWLLMKLNHVDTKNVFRIKYAGEIVFYLPKQTVNRLVGEINEFG